MRIYSTVLRGAPRGSESITVRPDIDIIFHVVFCIPVVFRGAHDIFVREDGS